MLAKATNRKHHSLLWALAIGSAVLAAPLAASPASSTRPPSGSSGGSVSHSPSSSGSSSSSHSSSSSESHSSSGGSWSSHDGGDRTPVAGNSTYHQGGSRDGHYYRGGGYWGSGWYDPWYWPRGGPWTIGWWGYWGPWAYYYDTPPYSYTRVYPNSDYGDYGALDLDISPEKAAVFLDGKRIGVADDYDGFPTYLWLKAGVYDLVFYADGYETIARQYVIRPGLIVDVEDSMTPGQAIRPEDLPAKTHVHRDERLQQDREAEDDAARGYRPAPPQGQSWREQRPPVEESDADNAARREVSEDARVAPARLKLDVEPGDASVYLDGRFIGTGAEIAELPNGLLIDAGQHRIEAVRPGRRAVNKEFSAEPGSESRIDLTLPEP